MSGKQEAIENISLECVQFTLACTVCGCRSSTLSSPRIDIDEVTLLATINDDFLYDVAIANGWTHTEDGSWRCDGLGAPMTYCKEAE
jgi:hypothetical protein